MKPVIGIMAATAARESISSMLESEYDIFWCTGAPLEIADDMRELEQAGCSAFVFDDSAIGDDDAVKAAVIETGLPETGMRKVFRSANRNANDPFVGQLASAGIDAIVLSSIEIDPAETLRKAIDGEEANAQSFMPAGGAAEPLDTRAFRKLQKNAARRSGRRKDRKGRREAAAEAAATTPNPMPPADAMASAEDPAQAKPEEVPTFGRVAGGMPDISEMAAETISAGTYEKYGEDASAEREESAEGQWPLGGRGEQKRYSVPDGNAASVEEPDDPLGLNPVKLSPEPKPKAGARPETDRADDAEPVQTPIPEPEPMPVPEPEPEPEPMPEPDPEPEPMPEPEPEPMPEPEPEPQSAPEPDPEPQAVTEPEPEDEQKTEPDDPEREERGAVVESMDKLSAADLMGSGKPEGFDISDLITPASGDGMPTARYKIAVTGLRRGVGTTHMTMAVAIELAATGRRVAVALCERKNLQQMKRTLATSPSENADCIKYCGVDVFYWDMQHKYADDYDIVVIDCGVLDIKDQRSPRTMCFQTSKAQVVLASAAPWDLQLIADIVNGTNPERIRNWTWAVYGADKSTFAAIEAGLRHTIGDGVTVMERPERPDLFTTQMRDLTPYLPIIGGDLGANPEKHVNTVR